MSQHYTHSGTVPIGGAIRTTIEGVAAATFLAIIYSYATNYIPFVYLNMLFTLGFGLVIGAIVSHESQSTKIRHGFVPAMIGAICGLAGLYFAWGADMIARVGAPPNRGVFSAIDPTILIPYVQFFYENGFWGVGKGGGVVSGIPLGIVWLIEAGMIVGLATVIPLGAYRKNVFCESCEAWAKAEEDVVRLKDSSADEIVPRVLAGEIAAFHSAPRSDAGADTFLRLKLDCCETCDEMNCLGLDQVKVTIDKEGKPSEKANTLINRLLISRRDVELVRSLAAPPAPETPAEADGELDDGSPEAAKTADGGAEFA